MKCCCDCCWLLLLLLLPPGVRIEQPPEPARGHPPVGFCSVWQQQQQQRARASAKLAAGVPAVQWVLEGMAHREGAGATVRGHWHVLAGVYPGDISVHG